MKNSPFRFLPSAFVKRRPIHFTFFVTRRCNSRCPFCFYLQRPQEGAGGAEISLEEAERFAPSLGRLLWLAFSGGEIFLRDDLPELSRLFYEANSPSVMLFPTNALMPGVIAEKTGHILRSCPDARVVVKLSLDGVGAEHDEMRGTPGGFERVLETYKRLRPLLRTYPNFELGVNTVFTSRNQDRMTDIIDFVRAEMKEIGTHTISLVRGDVSDGSHKLVNEGGYLEAVKALESSLRDGSSPTYRFRGAGLKAAQDILQRRSIHRTLVEGRRQLPCFAGRLNLVMTETGDLYPCEDFRADFRLGNIREHGYDARGVLGGERTRRVVSHIRESCFCTHECYMMTNILFNPRKWPALLKEYAALKA